MSGVEECGYSIRLAYKMNPDGSDVREILCVYKGKAEKDKNGDYVEVNPDYTILRNGDGYNITVTNMIPMFKEWYL